jgi:hypothetical protein
MSGSSSAEHDFEGFLNSIEDSSAGKWFTVNRPRARAPRSAGDPIGMISGDIAGGAVVRQ